MQKFFEKKSYKWEVLLLLWASSLPAPLPVLGELVPVASQLDAPELRSSPLS